jgi:hypothetical protein
MATSLRDIPGANRAPKRRRADRGVFSPARRTTIDMTPGGLKLGPSMRRSGRGFGPKLDLFVLVLVVGAVGVVVWIGMAFWNATRVDIAATGIDDGRALTPEAAAALDVTIEFATGEELYRADLTVDGIPVLEDVELPDDATSVQVRPQELVDDEIVENALTEGEHRIELAVSRPFLGDSTFDWTYVVDSVAPTLEVPPALDPVPIADPVTITGEVEEGVDLFLGDEPVDEDDGRFAVDFDSPPTGSLAFAAVDEAGNRTVKHVVVPVDYPSSFQAVHVSAAGWADERLRAHVESLIDGGLIDTVELDLKDESGIVGYDSELAKAHEIGAVTEDYDLSETVDYLEDKGVRFIGRIVAFRDPIYATAAWNSGQRDQVVQNPGGGMFSSYGGFTNFSHPEVREYNRAIALEAESMGVKDILWDYIRRPEGDPASMVVPGLEGPSSEAVTSFLAEMQRELRPRGAYQGASVFGISAAAGDSIAQDVPAMGAVVDYLAPMVYPSHWGPGMYRVESPINEPYEITKRSLADFQAVAKSVGVRWVPWLQDFTIHGVHYGEAEVRAQIQAARELGIDQFILWNPNVEYTTTALDPVASGAAAG